nr:C40 family peptidase [Ideonella livida]
MAPSWAAPEAAPSPAPGNAVLRLLQSSGLVESVDGRPSLLSQVQEGASQLVLTAMDFIGVRYRRGGNSADAGFDCSGFTRHIFENSIGLVLPRRAAEQANAPGLLSIPLEDLKPGDLVFFNTLRATFSHVGIYIGDGKFIHAPRTGAAVRVEDMRDAYWAKRFNGARRAPMPGEGQRTTP